MAKDSLVKGTEFQGGVKTQDPEAEGGGGLDESATLEQIAKMLERTLALLILLAARKVGSSSDAMEANTKQDPRRS